MYVKNQRCSTHDPYTIASNDSCPGTDNSSTYFFIFQEDPHDHDSGLDSVHFSSFNITNMDDPDEMFSLQNDFLKMQINGGPMSCRHDSGVYISGQYNSQLCSADDKSRTSTDSMVVDKRAGDSSCEHNEMNGCYLKLPVTIEEAIKVYESDKDGDNKLHLSIINGQTAASLFLIDIVPEYDWLSYSNHLGQTPLHLSVVTHQPTIVRRLICAGAFVIAQDIQGNTPLHLACRLGDEDAVKHLLTPVTHEESLQNNYTIPYQRVPQDLTIRNYEGHTCLHLAASAGHMGIVQLLLEAGADINCGDGKSGRSVLHFAADRGDIDLVELLLSWREVSADKRDYAGLTPLHLAYGRNHTDIARIICALGHLDISEVIQEYELDNLDTRY